MSIPVTLPVFKPRNGTRLDLRTEVEGYPTDEDHGHSKQSLSEITTRAPIYLRLCRPADAVNFIAVKNYQRTLTSRISTSTQAITVSTVSKLSIKRRMYEANRGKHNHHKPGHVKSEDHPVDRVRTLIGSSESSRAHRK